MVGVGAIFGAYRRRRARRTTPRWRSSTPGAEHGFRAFTVPLVTARAAVEQARARVRHPVGAARRSPCLRAAAGDPLRLADLAACPRRRARSGGPTRARLEDLLPVAPDPKAEDARACVASAAAFARARRAGAPPPPRSRRSRCLRTSGGRGSRAPARCCPAAPLPSGEVVAALGRRPDAGRLAAEGLRRLVLAALARSFGLAAEPDDAERALSAWLSRLRVPARERPDFLAACGLDDGAARALGEELALEARLLERAATIVPDGPAWEEGLALEARLTGAWVEEATRLASSRDGKPLATRRRGRSPRRRRTPNG